MTADFARFRYVDSFPLSLKARRAMWILVWMFLFRPTPRGIFNGWRIFLLRSFGARIGKGSRVAASCFVWGRYR